MENYCKCENESAKWINKRSQNKRKWSASSNRITAILFIKLPRVAGVSCCASIYKSGDNVNVFELSEKNTRRSLSNYQLNDSHRVSKALIYVVDDVTMILNFFRFSFSLLQSWERVQDWMLEMLLNWLEKEPQERHVEKIVVVIACVLLSLLVLTRWHFEIIVCVLILLSRK